ncbi:MAG TPA: NAD(P)-dependent oxidoreductase, partial [Spirochaetota bacterium]|nr:NAD(P)-dependent oxidoreductase [Spirochaetota bacterium]
KGFQPGGILVYDPFISPSVTRRFAVKKVSFKKLLEKADIISLHLPLTARTVNMFAAAQFDQMKKNAVLVNTSRGSIVNEKALYFALKNKKIAAAGLDVFQNEPPPVGQPLFKLPNLVLTRHRGWYSRESYDELKTKAARNIRNALLGRKVSSRLN